MHQLEMLHQIYDQNIMVINAENAMKIQTDWLSGSTAVRGLVEINPKKWIEHPRNLIIYMAPEYFIDHSPSVHSWPQFSLAV
jgi:protein phosphatase